MIVDHIDYWQRYTLGTAWEQAFDFLGSIDASAPEEETLIDGDRVFARVMSYPTRRETDASAVLEAHRKYIDIQMALRGSERIACYPMASLKPKGAYDPDKDVQFFDYEGPADVQINVFPGTFACLLPQDAHMPQLVTGSESAVVKKVVVKIACEALDL